MVTRSFNRSERVGGQVQKVLAGLMQNGISDPRLAQATITGVNMSRDLRIAKVYVTTHCSEHAEKDVLAGFQSAKGFIKRELARELGLRYMPDLRFYYDASFDYGSRIDRVLKSIQTDDEDDNPTTGK
ncbi:MAG: ribosome-binding factor A [Proteobacteria bacterium]|nr:MAG: ribosome-binding factor A [Pseudomonadota bacterium]PIE68036.1 MAG: ribosome-binding factor A [Deltaproteobacteria bacterium]